MIKRPLVWILGAFLLGVLIARQTDSIGILIALVLAAGVLISFLLVQKPDRIRSRIIKYCPDIIQIRKDRFLWSLPLMLLTGFLAMEAQQRLPALYYAFEQEIPCEISGRISMIVEKEWGQALYIKENTVFISRGKTYPCETVIVYSSDTQPLQIGNQITVRGSLIKFTQAANPGQFNEQEYYKIENIDFKAEADSITVTDFSYSKYHALLGRLKAGMMRSYSTILDSKEAGTLIAMLLGEKYLLEEDIKQLYQINGISHVLAISGLHISLIGMSIFWLLKKCKLPLMAATLVTIFMVYSYGVLTNFGVSTNRAVVMMIVMLLSALFGKTYDMLSATALSALIILLQNPLQLFSAGFQLSFAAILGIAVLFPGLKQLFPWKNSFLDGLLVSISAMMATTPIILYFFYQFPTYGLITNLLILPLVTLLTLSAILAGIAGMISLPFGIFLAGGPNYILKLYEAICRIGAAAPASLITVGRPELWVLLVSGLFLFIFVIIAKRTQRRYSIILLGLSLLVLFLPLRDRRLEITALDVGQGDGIVIRSEEGTTFMIDGGSSDVKDVGTYRILPFLKFRGIDRIDYALVTHSDMDHISGLMELMQGGVPVIGILILPEISAKDEQYLALEALAQQKKIPVRYIKAGDEIIDGGMTMDCLHPEHGYLPPSVNAYSAVLSLTFGEFDMLLTGDLEQGGEEQITRELQREGYEKEYGIHPVKDYDILKVAHHGSKYSTFGEFLELIKPEFALISCSKNNRYGHPSPETIKRLKEAGSKTLITYDGGAITIRTDGMRMEVQTYCVNGKTIE